MTILGFSVTNPCITASEPPQAKIGPEAAIKGFVTENPKIVKKYFRNDFFTKNAGNGVRMAHKNFQDDLWYPS